jgi:hypothetical protein
MAWAYCENGWCKDTREVTGRQDKRREKKRKTIKDLRNMGEVLCMEPSQLL